jgi:hypothetical protein
MLESAKLSKCLHQLTTVRNVLVGFFSIEQLLLYTRMVYSAPQGPIGCRNSKHESE